MGYRVKNTQLQSNKARFDVFKRTKFSNSSLSDSENKIESLDSIRGLAALSVVLSHFAGIFYPAMISGNMAPIHTSKDIFIYHSPLSIFFAGSFAVTLFFILSGFVLSLRFMSGKQKSLFPAAVKRYFRLMPVALISILIAHFIISFGLLSSVDNVGVITGSPSLKGQYYPFEPSILTALHQGIIGVFSNQALVKTSYNPVLWTIYYELLGSILVFGLASIIKNQPKRWILYIISIIAFINTFFVGFIIGLAIADLYANRPKIFKKIGEISTVYKFSLLFFALSIASFPSLGYFIDNGYHWTTINIFPQNIILTRTILQLISAIIIITLALSWRSMIRALEFKILRWLGKISYTLYATHLIIVFSLNLILFSKLFGHFSYNSAAILSTSISFTSMLLIASFTHKYVELPSIKLANKISDWAKK